MHRRPWKCVMVVVPPLAEAKHPDHPVVGAEVRGCERPPPIAVTHRVDRERDVLDGELAEESAPDESVPTSDQKGDHIPGRNPDGESSIAPHGNWVAQYEGAVPIRLGIRVVEEPAPVGMP